jgi:NADPH-dependent 2,4-dienoyl-CoA reductase/sulfur reductase-like enzyme
VHCEALRDDAAHDQEVSGKEFTVAYDKLVIATGAEASTFGIKGVHEHAIFLRDVKNAMDIRSKLLLNLMKCEIPGGCCSCFFKLSSIHVVHAFEFTTVQKILATVKHLAHTQASKLLIKHACISLLKTDFVILFFTVKSRYISGGEVETSSLCGSGWWSYWGGIQWRAQ